MADISAIDEQCCRDAEQFRTLFYEAMDKKRKMVSNMYTDGACLVYNGNPVTGRNEIDNFLIDLPDSTHIIKSVDAQVVNAEEHTGGQKAMMIMTAGTLTAEQTTRCFTQTFLLIKEDKIWKIGSDRFRFID